MRGVLFPSGKDAGSGGRRLRLGLGLGLGWVLVRDYTAVRAFTLTM